MNANYTMQAGRLVRDPEVKTVGSGTTLCQFTLANSRKFKVNGEEREETLFIDCKAWGKPGEIIGQYMKKGSSILIEGELRLEKWDGQDGAKHSKHVINVEKFQFGDKKPEGEGAPF